MGGSGLISKEELQTVQGGSFDEKEISDMIRDVDTSGDGEIDYDEFISYFRTPHANDESVVSHAGQPSMSKRRTNTQNFGVALDQMLEATKGCQETQQADSFRPQSRFPGLLGARRRVSAFMQKLPTGK